MIDEEVLETEFSEDFIRMMKNRMIVSYFKYGNVGKNYNRKEYNVNAVASLRKRLELYEKTGNTEWLIDVANFAMIEFMCPQHKTANFRPTSSDESPGLEGLSQKEIESLDKGEEF